MTRIATRLGCLTLCSMPALGLAEVPAAERFGPADLDRLAHVAEPALSPDGSQVAYSVTVTDVEEDRQQSDLWRVGFDGRERVQLTFTRQHDEWAPAWSPDGRWLAFLSDRGDEEAATQVWALPVGGGEARPLTHLPGGVSDFAWSPDGTRIVLVAADPARPPGAPKPRNPPPIVTERFHYKEDVRGYLGAGRDHLYLLEVEAGTVEPLTTGPWDDRLPAWSPDGRQIVFVTRRGERAERRSNVDLYLVEARAGGEARLLATVDGADNDADTGARPQWSPDGRRIAFRQGGEQKWVYYAPMQLAIIEVATGRVSVPAPLDRWVQQPRWAADGRSVYVLLEDNRRTHLARIELASGQVARLTTGPRFDAGFDLARDGRLVVLGGDATTPYELAALERGRLRALGSHNAWLAQRRLVRYEEITFRSRDGTSIDGFVVKPLDYEPARRYPAILRIHGGPVYQFSHEFMPDWQAYAARGYVVIAANPRGSSGRGFDFARAIYADWGGRDVEDVLAAVDHVVAAGLADPDRLAVGGRSYGGILTNYVIASDARFKAAVSGAGSSNAAALYGHDMYAREYEFELGVPWRNPELYERLSYPFFHADRIRTPTLFYCAERDFNVPCLGSEQMYQALRSLDVPAQLVIYPGEHHALAVPSYLRDRLQRMLDWYGRWLAVAP